jgi:predicted nucleic acid-binding protein
VEDWSNEADCQVWRLTKTYGLRVMDAVILALALVVVLITVAEIMDDE